MTDLSLYKVDLDTPQPNGRSGESPRSAFTKYNDLIKAIEDGLTGRYTSDSAPATTFSHMEWLDTSTTPATIKRRNVGNTGWEVIGSYDQKLGSAAGGQLAESSSPNKVPVTNDEGLLDESFLDLVNRVSKFNPANIQPDVYIPFNDSLQIVRGYGTHEKIDVSPAQDGSVMVELPTKSVDFSRASGRYSINKSGELVQLGIDEAGITKGGMESYQSYVNLMTESGNAVAWSKSNVTIAQSSVLGPDAESVQAFSVIESAGNEIHRVFKGIPVTEAHTYSVKVIAKALGTERANLRIESGNIYGNTVGVNLLTGEHVMSENSNNPVAVEVKTLKDGWVQIDITGVAKEDRSNGLVYIYFCPTNGGAFPLSWQGDGVSGGLIRAIQATETSVPMPYIESGSNPVASGDDVATIPLRNNLPAPGESFSISVRTHIPNTKAAVFGFGLEQFEKLTLWRFDKDNPVRIRISDAVQTLSITSGQFDTHKPCKYTIAFDADAQTLSFYVDKAFAGSVDVSTVDWSQVYSPVAIGYLGRCTTVGGNAAPLNGVFEDLKFYHYALSAEQIKAGV